MKKTILFLFLFAAVSIQAQTMHRSYLNYIEKYSEIAVEQQITHKIPASIKLAQGLLESAAGRGKLVQMSNNHFGIKCGDWRAAKVYFDDDKKDECFRKYKSARDSYEDHSLFLVSGKRYAKLFELDPTDYKGWAHGLKEAGYATDPDYAHKLIKLIDDYDLHMYDIGRQPDMRKADSRYNRETYTWGSVSTIFLKGHQLYRNNGVKCVFAEAGDTYASIANEFDLKESKLLEYNDLARSAELEPGTVVYLSKKKKKASSEFQTHTVVAGESMYRIAQKYAVRLQTLYDLNSMPYNKGAEVGQVLKLR